MEMFDVPEVPGFNVHNLDARKAEEIFRAYVEAKMAGTEQEMFAKYGLDEQQQLAVGVTARMVAIFGKWDESKGEPNEGLMRTILSAFDDANEKETIGLLVTMSHYAWKHVENERKKYSGDV